eukprot:TRINITY_DN45_c0_g2_i10.p2 TRINITY_DN45_c0_g2~~TRINITY_DN45_c0_g2_i10.p2  ORF type:complete len:67 (-),score=44.41 TRINITY_DN45_c0_g2_i10:2-202(-)
MKEYNETKRQMEEDLDIEIEELKQKYESILSEEREATLRLKGENGVKKKKYRLRGRSSETAKAHRG